MVSSATEFASTVVRLPGREPTGIEADRIGQARLQPVRTGAAVEVPHAAALRPDDGITVTTWVWLAPGAQRGSRRALLASWGGDGDDGWALVLDADGRPCFEVAAGGRHERAVTERPLPADSWCLLRGRLDPVAGAITVESFAGDPDDAAPFDAGREPASLAAPGPSPGPLLIAAELRGAGATAHLDGKLEAPTVRAGRGDERLVGAWSLGDGRGRRVVDQGPHGFDGRCINGPLRGVTGRRWSGDIHDWRCAADQYAAMHFHSDATDDLGWEPSLELELPAGLASGVYAVILTADGCEDVVPFAVRRPAGAEPATNVVLLPTFTYLAYSCERDAPRQLESPGPEDRWVAGNRLRSLYDRYDDGCGVYEASIRRPLTQLRPGYRCPQHGGPHGLAQDLILLAFLERRGFAADLLTDHDLHAVGATALAGHRTVITGAHPEYATAELLDALDAHVEGGGGLAYLGGNGLNGRVSVDPERPHVLELRRNETQGLAWQALPGEHHHAATGAYGGDWRRQGRPEHRFLGVGLSAFGDAPASSYQRVGAGEADPAAELIFAGLEPEAPIGSEGVILGGAAGFEVDNHDPVLGSPSDAAVLASATLGPDYSIWPDDVRDGSGAAPKRRADMVLRRPTGGGAVFAVGSIAWTGCLEGEDDNPVARVTENVLRELAREHPFEVDGV
ncbi:MAG TPA: N,N-dimethylformamidase beta subunit family domain-containing protein [Solirubrobacterales bacterium]|nr:N,N-dimethylformamidase beta subunit family domain-containing protein [Solirubrobacterales bacterium]